MDTGKIIGVLKGFVLQNNKVSFLYCNSINKYFYIPIANATIGSDAIMLKDSEDLNILHTDAETKVYSIDGKEIGTVTSFEMDETFHIMGLVVEDLFIEINKVLHMENVIIVDMTETNIENSTDVVEEDVDAIYSPMESPITIDEKHTLSHEDDIHEEANLINHELNLETQPTSIDSSSEEEENNYEDTQEVSKSDTDSIGCDDPLDIEIDPRYHHLCGKKLLEDIVIAKETYEEGTTVDAALVQFAIDNNAIIKIIMNTEE